MSVRLGDDSKTLRAAARRLRDAARATPPGTYTRETCPLAGDHYDLTQFLFGSGCYNWTCGFCGRSEAL